MVYEFGSFALDMAKRQLARHGEGITLAPKTFDLLLLLLESNGRALSKTELIQALWPDTIVEEANLSFQISTLRKALGEDGAKWIETIPKHGYRFSGRVARREGDTAAARGEETLSPAAKSHGIYLIWALVVAIGATTTIWLVKRQPSTGSRPQNPQPLTSHAGVQQHPSLSPDGSQVANSWDGPDEDNFDIYVKLVGPGEPIRLTTNPAMDVDPAWSPDGRQIAFIRFASTLRGSIFLIPALKGAERKLADVAITAEASRLSWSPNGRTLAFGGKLNESGSPGIWLLSVDGSAPPHRITTAGEYPPFDFSPAFSPDGRYLAFVRARAYNSNDLYVQRLSEGLAPSGEPRRVISNQFRIDSIAWVNDRKLIYCTGPIDAMHRLQTIQLAADDGGAQPESAGFGEGAQSVSVSRNGTVVYSLLERDVDLWQSDLSGSKANSQKLAPSRYQNWTPAWSHDGHRFAFASTRSGIEEVWVADADGSQPIQITRMGSGHTTNPRWSRDDRVILFNSWTPRSHLYTVGVADGSVTQLTHDQADDLEATWSRDDKWIYFGSNRSGRFEIYRMPGSGGTAVPITRNGGVHPEESRDGQWLYYSKDLESPTTIWKVPRNAGEEAPVVEGLTYSNNFAVSEKGIYFVSGRLGRNDNAIEFYDFATGKRKVISVLQKAVSWGVALSPDQRSLLYPLIDHTASNLMLVQNFQ
jgi:Tol biopolymer transport system component/DNA-binding winged helix-turn-helix (wHTH) protein